MNLFFTELSFIQGLLTHLHPQSHYTILSSNGITIRKTKILLLGYNENITSFISNDLFQISLLKRLGINFRM